jgi:hypothetical protein
MTTWLAVQSVITGSTTTVQQTPQKKVFLTVRSFVAIVKINSCLLLLFMINELTYNSND